MAQVPKIIDLTRSYLPGDPNAYPENLHATQAQDQPEKSPPIVAFEGYNFLPTANGYKSYFGTANTIDIDVLPSRCQHLIMFQTADYFNHLIALCEDGIWVSDPTTSGAAWTQVVVLAFDPAIFVEWTYCVLQNVLYMYSAGDSDVHTYDSLDTLSNFTPTFLNMTGQMGIFRAGTRLGFWDSANSIAWSSPYDTSEFTPEIETLTGNTIFSSIIGRIVTIKEHGDGYMVYCTKSIIGVRYQANSNLLWDGNLITTAGVRTSKEVTIGFKGTDHYAWTTEGFVTVGDYNVVQGQHSIQPLLTELGDLLKEKGNPLYLRVLEGRFLFIGVLDSDYIDGIVSTYIVDVPPQISTIFNDGVAWDGVDILPSIISGNSFYMLLKHISAFNDPLYGGPAAPEFIPVYRVTYRHMAPSYHYDNLDLVEDPQGVHYAELLGTTPSVTQTYADDLIEFALNWDPINGYTSGYSNANRLDALSKTAPAGFFANHPEDEAALDYTIKDFFDTQTSIHYVLYNTEVAATLDTIAVDYITDVYDSIGELSAVSTRHTFTKLNCIPDFNQPLESGQYYITDTFYDFEIQNDKYISFVNELITKVNLSDIYQLITWDYNIEQNLDGTWPADPDPINFAAYAEYLHLDPTLWLPASRTETVWTYDDKEIVGRTYFTKIAKPSILYGNSAVTVGTAVDGTISFDFDVMEIDNPSGTSAMNYPGNNPPGVGVYYNYTFSDADYISAWDAVTGITSTYDSSTILTGPFAGITLPLSGQRYTSFYVSYFNYILDDAWPTVSTNQVVPWEVDTGITLPFSDADLFTYLQTISPTILEAATGITATLPTISAAFTAGAPNGFGTMTYTLTSQSASIIATVEGLDGVKFNLNISGGTDDIKGDVYIFYKKPASPSDIFGDSNRTPTKVYPYKQVTPSFTARFNYVLADAVYGYNEYRATRYKKAVLNQTRGSTTITYTTGDVTTVTEPVTPLDIGDVFTPENEQHLWRYLGTSAITPVDGFIGTFGTKNAASGLYTWATSPVTVPGYTIGGNTYIGTEPGPNALGGYTTTGGLTVTTPGATFLLQEGTPAPLYPTYVGAFVLDIFLKKWGKMKADFTELLEYQPVNSPTAGTISYTNFGIVSGLLNEAGEICLFTNEPATGYIKYGKIGYYRKGMTTPFEVRMQFRTASTGTSTIECSMDGRNIDTTLEKEDTFTDAYNFTHYVKGVSCKWFNIKISGKYDLTFLEFNGTIAGRR